MEKNYSSTNHSAVYDRALSLPHFDEDATLLSARRVVPLHEVKAETRSKRRVIFWFTILAATFVGAMSATLLLMQSEQKSQSGAEVQESQPRVSSSGAAGGFSSESAEARVPVLAEPDEEPKMREMPTSDSSIKKRQTEAISRNSGESARAGSSDHERDADFEDEERELRRAERRNERREARRQIREKREPVSDDLLRIREIFEGLPRP
ncbi:MAG: hypothetical protein H0V18_00270 [Pyrinomonadaceae bacterium]|nr:hypothetical protein [Pyrinomonadaceae bacterium]